MSRPTPKVARCLPVLDDWARRSQRSVIFDFNGTLSDDEPILQEIFTELFAEHLGYDLTPEDYYSRLAGHSDREIVELVVGERAPGELALAEELLRQRRDRYKEKVTHTSPIGPQAVQLVHRLASGGVPMAIVTGAQREDVMCVVENSDVRPYIDVIVTEEDVRCGKPDPEGFLAGAELLGRKPEDILVFEDSHPGVMAASAAGMACIAVCGSRPSPRVAAAADAVVPALDAALLDGVANI